MGIGMQELLVILIVGLVLFGSKKLPEVGSGLGKAIRDFRRAMSEPDEVDISSSSAKKKEKLDAPREG